MSIRSKTPICRVALSSSRSLKTVLGVEPIGGNFLPTALGGRLSNEDLALALGNRALENHNHLEWSEKNRILAYRAAVLAKRKLVLAEKDMERLDPNATKLAHWPINQQKLALNEDYDQLERDEQKLALLQSMPRPLQIQRQLRIFSDLLQLASDNNQKEIIQRVIDFDQQGLASLLAMEKRHEEAISRMEARHLAMEKRHEEEKLSKFIQMESKNVADATAVEKTIAPR
jgi:ABC-type uncharacterized transport system permease subunit